MKVERVVVQRCVVASLLEVVCAKVDVAVLLLWKEAVLEAPVAVVVVLWKSSAVEVLSVSPAVVPAVELVECSV